MRKHISALIVAGVISVSALTGCSAGTMTPSASAPAATQPAPATTAPAAGGQSVKEACSVAAGVLSSMQSEMASSAQEVAKGDFSGVVTKFNEFGDKMQEAVAKVNNVDVKDALGALGTQVKKFAGLFDGVKNGDLGALAQKTSELSKINTDIQAAGKQFAALCSQ